LFLRDYKYEIQLGRILIWFHYGNCCSSVNYIFLFMKKMPPWSPSSLSKNETCPRQYYHLKVAKDVKESETEVQRWGIDVHEALEKSVKNGEPLGDRFKDYEWVKQIIEKVPGTKAAELELAIKRDRTPCKFHDEDCWTRCVLDLVIVNDRVGFIGDYKTGKKKNGSRQLLQNALVLFASVPQLETIFTAYIWLQTKEITKAVYKRDNVDRLWEMFYSPVQDLEFSYENNVWPAKPSGLCRGWCPVKQCEHWRPKR
jgi:PD-(D/E)XK nuclease superfamily